MFGLGVLGAGMVAAIVVSLALAWGLGEVAGYRRSLEQHPLQARWFYGVYAVCVVGGAVLVAVWPNLVSLNVGVQVMNALLLPLVLGFLIALAVKALPRGAPAARLVSVGGGGRVRGDLRAGGVWRVFRGGAAEVGGCGGEERSVNSARAGRQVVEAIALEVVLRLRRKRCRDRRQKVGHVPVEIAHQLERPKIVVAEDIGTMFAQIQASIASNYFLPVYRVAHPILERSDPRTVQRVDADAVPGVCCPRRGCFSTISNSSNIHHGERG